MKDLTIKEFFFLLIIAVLCFAQFKSCEKDNIQGPLIDSYKDSMTVSRNEKGQEIAVRKLMHGSIEALQLSANDKDSTIRKLVKLVNKKTISATIVNTETVSKGETKTDSIVYEKGDSVFPTYKTHWSDRWSSGMIVAKKDSIIHNFISYNEFDVVQKFERQKGLKGFFKADSSYVEIANLNPNTTTKALASFSVKPPKQKRWPIFSSGAVSGIVAVKIIKSILKSK